MYRTKQVKHAERLMPVWFSRARERHHDRMVSPVAFLSCFLWSVRWCHTVCNPGTDCIERSPLWNCSSFHNSSVKISISHDSGVSWLNVCFMSSSSARRVASEGSWMRFCINLPISLEGVGSNCWLSWHATISVEEAHDWSFSCGFLLTNRLTQSANFKYCSIIFLAVCGRPLVVGILADVFGHLVPLYTWYGGPRLLSRRGRESLFCVPLTIELSRIWVMSFLPTIATPIVLSRCLSRFGVDLGVGPRCPESPLYVSLEFVGVWRQSRRRYPVPGGGSRVSMIRCLGGGHMRRVYAKRCPSSRRRAFASRVISAFDVQSHSCMVRWRLFFMIWQATSSVCMHLSTWVSRGWVMTVKVVVYPILPISFGDVHGWFAVLSLSFHDVL